MPTGGCTWDVTAEGQLSPCHQLQQGQAVSDAQAAYARIWTLLLGKGRGRVRSSQQRGKENKVRGGQGILGNHKHRMEWSPRVIIPPVWPTAPDISSSCSGCNMAPNACLLLLPCCLSAFPLQLLKPQMPNLLCSSWEPLLHADTLILLEKVCTI